MNLRSDSANLADCSFIERCKTHMPGPASAPQNARATLSKLLRLTTLLLLLALSAVFLLRLQGQINMHKLASGDQADRQKTLSII